MDPMPTWPVLMAAVCHVVAVGAWYAMVWHLIRMAWQLRWGICARGSAFLWNPLAVFRTASFSATGQTCCARTKQAFATWLIAFATSAFVAMLGTAR
jgi:hypothetical protein